MALATTLPFLIVLLYAQFWLYKNLVYSIVLLTSSRKHTEVLFLLVISKTQIAELLGIILFVCLFVC
jgi:hypothetical protein